MDQTGGTPSGDRGNCTYLGPATRHGEELLALLRDAPLLEAFDAAEIERLSAFMDCYAADRFAWVFDEGDAGDWLLFVLTGELELAKRDAEGRQRVLARLGPGRLVGEMSFIDGEPRFASCRAMKPCDIVTLDRSGFERLARADSALGCKLLWVLLQRSTGYLRRTSLLLLPHLPFVTT